MKLINRSFVYGASAVGVMLVLSQCAKQSTTPAATGPTSLSQLPSATGPVVSAIRRGKSAFNTYAATTGKKLSELGSVSWTGKSRAACEQGAIIREAYGQASEPDTILCYMKMMADNGFDLGTSDYYDGINHYASLAGVVGDDHEGGNALPKVKFNITKNSNGGITSFKMWMCMDGTTASPSQDGYVGLGITDATGASITSVQSGSGDWGTYSSRTGASGSINSSGAWTSKTITISTTNTYTSGESTGSFSGSATINQYSDHVSVEGWQTGNMTGTHDGQTFQNTFSRRLFGLQQILNADKLSTFAIGDGSLKYIISDSGSFGGVAFPAHDAQKIASWSGDTLSAITSSTGDHYADASAGTVPATGTVSISFSADETWDCNAESGASFSAVTPPSSLSVSQMDALFQTCEALVHNWVNCYQDSGGGEGSDEAY